MGHKANGNPDSSRSDTTASGAMRDQPSLRGPQAEEKRIRAAYARRSRKDARYSWFNCGHLFIEQEIERRVLALLKRQGCSDSLPEKRILEVGCGIGFRLRQFVKWGAEPQNLVGLDLLPDDVVEARRLSPTSTALCCRNAADLEFPDETFDIVFQSMVFSSVLDASMRQRIAAEMLRVLKTDGFIIWYDFHCDNPWNPDVRGIRRREIRQLFSGCRITLERLTLVPHASRLLAPYSWLLCYFFSTIPLLCTHYLGVVRKMASREAV